MEGPLSPLLVLFYVFINPKISHMKQLLFMAATVMPTEDIIEKLEDALKEYKVAPTNENKRAVEMFSFMLMINLENGGSIKKMTEMLQEVEKVDKAKNLLTPMLS